MSYVHECVFILECDKVVSDWKLDPQPCAIPLKVISTYVVQLHCVFWHFLAV